MAPGGVEFDPTKDIGDLSGKVILVTGGTTGLGYQSIIEFAKHNPSHIFFTGRNANSAKALVQETQQSSPNVHLTFLQCDLSSLDSVKSASEKFLSTSQRLDILMCNAGIMAAPPSLTADGYELQFGTNHVGHALLIKKLLPALKHTKDNLSNDVRIINLASAGFNAHPKQGIVFSDLRTVQDYGALSTWTRYGQSKLANILYARELARHYPDITTVAIHPGATGTGLVGNLGWMQKALIYFLAYFSYGTGVASVSQGCLNQLWAATVDKSEVSNGEYYEPVGLLSPNHDNVSRDDELAEQLWNWTEKELERY